MVLYYAGSYQYYYHVDSFFSELCLDDTIFKSLGVIWMLSLDWIIYLFFRSGVAKYNQRSGLILVCQSKSSVIVWTLFSLAS